MLKHLNTSMLDQGKVSVEIKAGVASLTFFHPRSNSLPGKLLRQIAAEIDALGADDKAGVILLKSEGEKAFCAGASFDELKAVQNPEQGFEFFSGFAHVILAIRRCPKFVVTRVQGKTVGGGVGIVAASDYAFAIKDASIRLSEYALGFGPFIIGPAVQRKVGLAAFSELAIGADWRDAEWARSNGLYNQICANSSELDSALAEFCGKLALANPEATTKLKRILWEGTENWEKLVFERAKITSALALSSFVQNKIKEINT